MRRASLFIHDDCYLVLPAVATAFPLNMSGKFNYAITHEQLVTGLAGQSFDEARLTRMLIFIGALILAAVSLSSPAFAISIVYDNLGSIASFVTVPTRDEFGDQITLSGTDRIVTNFTFDYMARDTGYTSGTEGVMVRFYANGGVDGALSTLLFESASTPIVVSNSSQRLSLSIPSVLVPDTFTWTVAFTGMHAQAEYPALQVYETPRTGSSGDFFWWLSYGRFDVPHLIDNFSASVTASSTPVAAVPEPSTLLLIGIGALIIPYCRSRQGHQTSDAFQKLNYIKDVRCQAPPPLCGGLSKSFGKSCRCTAGSRRSIWLGKPR